MPGTAEGGPALELRGLRVTTREGAAVEGVDLSLERGRTLCLVGESGCGKSLTCCALMGLLPAGLRARAASLRLGGRETPLPVDGPPAGAAMIHQDADASLNPVMRIGRQIMEAMPRDGAGRSRARARAEAERLLDRVGIRDPRGALRRYPHEFSGGMNQRVAIAIALAARPSVLIADEPTTALDVTVQARILELLRRVQAETGAALLFITHDLSVVAEIGDDMAVMYAGRIVEQGPTRRIFDRPRHPYAAALMACRPRLAERAPEGFPGIPGMVPPVGLRPAGCAFAPRCARRLPRCEAEAPALDAAGLACFNPLPDPAPDPAPDLAPGSGAAPARFAEADG